MQPTTSTHADSQDAAAFGLLRHAMMPGARWGTMTAQGPGWRVLSWPRATRDDTTEVIAAQGLARALSQFDGPFVPDASASQIGPTRPDATTHMGRIDDLHTVIGVVPGLHSHAVVITQDPQWRRNAAAVAATLCADVLAQGPGGARWQCGPVGVRQALWRAGCGGALQVALQGSHVAVALEQSAQSAGADTPWPQTDAALGDHLDAALDDVRSLNLTEAVPTAARRRIVTPGGVGELRAVRVAAACAPPTWWLRGTLLWQRDAEQAVALIATAHCPEQAGPATFEALHALCSAWQLS